MCNELSDKYCEGWCFESGGKGKFPDCTGCEIAKLEETISELKDVCLETQRLTDIIVGSPPDTPIKGKIESLAFSLGHHPHILNPEAIK